MANNMTIRYGNIVGADCRYGRVFHLFVFYLFMFLLVALPYMDFLISTLRTVKPLYAFSRNSLDVCLLKRRVQYLRSFTERWTDQGQFCPCRNSSHPWIMRHYRGFYKSARESTFKVFKAGYLKI